MAEQESTALENLLAAAKAHVEYNSWRNPQLLVAQNLALAVSQAEAVFGICEPQKEPIHATQVQ